MIVIGSIHFNDCPAEPYIPLFLIVGGMYSSVMTIVEFYSEASEIQ